MFDIGYFIGWVLPFRAQRWLTAHIEQRGRNVMGIYTHSRFESGMLDAWYDPQRSKGKKV